MSYFNSHLRAVLNEYQAPTKLIRVTDHALDRFRQRVPGGREVDKGDIAQFVGVSEVCSERNYKLIRDAHRRRRSKGSKSNMFRLYGLGGDQYVVFAMSQKQLDYDFNGVKAGSPILLVVTCWVNELYPNN